MRDIGTRPAEPHPRPQFWLLLRRAAIKRDGCCRACGADSDLEVHHVTYALWGFEQLSDVTVFCGACHDLITGAQMQLRDRRREKPAIPVRRLEVERPAWEPGTVLPPPVTVRAAPDRAAFPSPRVLPPPLTARRW